jgi:hypothetical protein
MKTRTYFALALIVASGDAFAGSPAPYNGGRDTAVYSDAIGNHSGVDKFGHPTRKPIPDDMSVEDFKTANPGMAIDADPNNRTCGNSKSMKTVCRRSSHSLR